MCKGVKRVGIPRTTPSGLSDGHWLVPCPKCEATGEVEPAAETFGALYGKDLAGWQLGPIWVVELKCGRLGTFMKAPNGVDDDVAFRERERFKYEVLDRISGMGYSMSHYLALINIEETKAYVLGSGCNQEGEEPIDIFTEASIDRVAEAARKKSGLR